MWKNERRSVSTYSSNQVTALQFMKNMKKKIILAFPMASRLLFNFRKYVLAYTYQTESLCMFQQYKIDEYNESRVEWVFSFKE